MITALLQNLTHTILYLLGRLGLHDGAERSDRIVSPTKHVIYAINSGVRNGLHCTDYSVVIHPGATWASSRIPHAIHGIYCSLLARFSWLSPGKQLPVACVCALRGSCCSGPCWGWQCVCICVKSHKINPHQIKDVGTVGQIYDTPTAWGDK